MGAQGAALAKEPKAQLAGTYHEGRDIDARLRAAQAQYHLVSPFAAVGALPPGCGVQIALVRVDIEHETYDVGGGKRGLSKSALDRIASALGLSWNASASRRLDDGRDPHYCCVSAVGHYKASDGQTQTVTGTKEMDLREGSAQLDAIRAKSKKGSPDGQIRDQRAHIMAHAETKARLRAIRSMGLRTSYERAELEKPFFVARVVFTGQTSDPELRRAFALKTADSFLGGHTMLYGGAPMPGGQAPALPASTRSAPPLGSVPYDEDDALPLGDGDVPPGDVLEHAPAPEETPPRARRNTPAPSSGGVMKFGKAKGTSFAKADEDDLTWYRGAVARSAEDPEKSRFRADNLADLAAIDAELARRRGEDEPDEEGSGELPDDEGWPGDRE